MIEQAALILGKARELMAGFVAKGAALVSTDSVIIDRAISMECDSLSELARVESDLTVAIEADAVLIFRTRLYFLLQRVDNIRLPKDLAKPYAVDDKWAVVKVARHGLPVDKYALAELVLASIKAKKLIVHPLPRLQLLSAVSAVRLGLGVNAEVRSSRLPILRWDNKRVLDNPNVNPWVDCSSSHPVVSEARLTAAERHRLVVNANRRRARREHARSKRDEVLKSIAMGMPVREIACTLEIPRSTVSDLKRKLWTPMRDFLATQRISVPPEEDEGGSEGGAP